VATQAGDAAVAAQQAPAPQAPATGAPSVTVINQVGGGPAVPSALVDASDKSPGTALILSFLFVGLGQLYNGQVAKGILMFFGCVILWFMLLGWIINIWSMIDAYSVAKRKRLQWQLLMTGQSSPSQVARLG
jgi:TM2 domain-containing membrane protein YozV